MLASQPQQAGTDVGVVDYKAQLDAAADQAKSPEPNQNQESSSSGVRGVIVDKVSQYVPAVTKILGKETEGKKPSPEPKAISGPPDRPDHDPQIEEFVRDQHKSMPLDLDDPEL